MALVTIKPSAADRAVADAIAAHAARPIEHMAEFATWGADGHVLAGLALGWWAWTRLSHSPPQTRIAANHIALTTGLSILLPHLLKAVIDQERPDRRTLLGHGRGIPFSGKTEDAFPSGHAVHIGALMSVASTLPKRPRWALWLLGAGFAATRIVLLAHWVSDVAAGLALGAGLERLTRRWTGYKGMSRPADRPSMPPRPAETGRRRA